MRYVDKFESYTSRRRDTAAATEAWFASGR